MGSTSSKTNDSNGHAYFKDYKYDNRCYTGNFDVKNGKPILTSDNAQYVNPDGIKYEGGIKDGRPHGTGCFTLKNDDDVYKGNFVNGALIGYCMIYYSSGNIYEGQVNNNYNQHGYGKMIYTNGDVYEGNWSNNKKHGHGKYIWPNGNICEGIWEYDQRNGLFTFHWNGNKHLIDLLKMTNITASGMYVNGKKEGIFHVTGEEDGKKKEYNCKYANNILVDYKQIN